VLGAAATCVHVGSGGRTVTMIELDSAIAQKSSPIWRTVPHWPAGAGQCGGL